MGNLRSPNPFAERHRTQILLMTDLVYEFRTSHPCECAEERRARRNRASDCLSEASLSSTPAGPSTAGCPQRSGGTQTVGSPFFCLLFFGEAKKSESPAAATERHRNSSTSLVIDSIKNALIWLSPILRYLRTNGEKASKGSARTGTGTGTGTGPGIGTKNKETGFGIGRFRGRRTNSPRLRLALRVPRFASQRNCDPTPKTV